MTTHTRAIAEAFSRHRFAETYDHLADDVKWIAVGEGETTGKNAVIAACEAATAELATTTTQFTRFVTAADNATAAVDVIGRYRSPDGTTSIVSSCDFYEFQGGQVVLITSYAAEVSN